MLIFSSQVENIYAANTIKTGASGYLSKSATTATIKRAILKVFKGGKVKGSLSYNTIVVEVGATISGPMKPIEKDQVLLIENK